MSYSSSSVIPYCKRKLTAVQTSLEQRGYLIFPLPHQSSSRLQYRITYSTLIFTKTRLLAEKTTCTSKRSFLRCDYTRCFDCLWTLSLKPSKSNFHHFIIFSKCFCRKANSPLCTWIRRGVFGLLYESHCDGVYRVLLSTSRWPTIMMMINIRNETIDYTI